MHLSLNAQKELLSNVERLMKYSTQVSSSGTFDRNSPCLNALFILRNGMEVVVYVPNSLFDDSYNEEFNTFQLTIANEGDEPFLTKEFNDLNKLVDEIFEQV